MNNVNTWLANDPIKRYLLRILRGTGDQPGISRAMLSKEYEITDNLDVLMAVLEGIRRVGVHPQVSRCNLTERRMYVKVGCPQVTACVPWLLASYRSPFTGLRDDPGGLLPTLTHSQRRSGRWPSRPRPPSAHCHC
jgi:hypothetical protein